MAEVHIIHHKPGPVFSAMVEVVLVDDRQNVVRLVEPSGNVGTQYPKEIGSQWFGTVENLAAGLALGGSLQNAVVLDDRQVLNRDGLRFPDEFVRHKALDLLGDLALLGLPIQGHVEAMRSGHQQRRHRQRRQLDRPDNQHHQQHGLCPSTPSSPAFGAPAWGAI